MNNSKKTPPMKKVTAEAKKMSAVEIALKKFDLMTKLSRDRIFFQSKLQLLEKQVIAIDEADTNLFETEDRGLRLEFIEGYSGTMIKISNEFVIRSFITFITEQMSLKIGEIDEEIVKIS
jgi:hypothetical protein